MDIDKMNRFEKRLMIGFILMCIATFYLILEYSYNNEVETIEQKILDSYFKKVIDIPEKPFVINPFDNQITYIEAIIIWLPYVLGIYFLMDLIIASIPKCKNSTKHINTKNDKYNMLEKIKGVFKCRKIKKLNKKVPNQKELSKNE